MKSHHPAGARVEAVKIVAIVAVVQFLIGGWFSWTASRSEPRDIPVAIAAEPARAKELTTLLERTGPGAAFELKTASSAADADAMLKDREAYGAFVAAGDGKGWELHLASAASPAVASALTGRLAELTGTSALVKEVVPASDADPHGTGITMGFLPLVVTSVIAGLLFVLKVPVPRLRLPGVVAFAVLSGALSSLMLTVISGVLPGSYLTNAAVIALLELGMTGFIAGLGSLVGPGGIAGGAVVMFLIGNPLSGIASAPELLPGPLGTVGQLLPPGAAGSLIRSAGAFDGAGILRPAAVLVVWAAIGLTLLALAARRPAPGAPSEATAPTARPAEATAA
ncbi:ABC transporter permease [Streptomyces sp. NPDC049837]|uniref:ABC transporter permease n=1 Tax=Streptomyces sp. NPDC049837 TaxID=3155277 RepID=UPI00342FA716